jgi:hypothetical protein
MLLENFIKFHIIENIFLSFYFYKCFFIYIFI